MLYSDSDREKLLKKVEEQERDIYPNYWNPGGFSTKEIDEDSDLVYKNEDVRNAVKMLNVQRVACGFDIIGAEYGKTITDAKIRDSIYWNSDDLLDAIQKDDCNFMDAMLRVPSISCYSSHKFNDDIRYCMLREDDMKLSKILASADIITDAYGCRKDLGIHESEICQSKDKILLLDFVSFGKLSHDIYFRDNNYTIRNSIYPLPMGFMDTDEIIDSKALKDIMNVKFTSLAKDTIEWSSMAGTYVKDHKLFNECMDYIKWKDEKHITDPIRYDIIKWDKDDMKEIKDFLTAINSGEGWNPVIQKESQRDKLSRLKNKMDSGSKIEEAIDELLF